MSLPTESKARKDIPVFTGFVNIFPDAMAAVAQLTAIATKQHHPDGGVFWDKAKSTDEQDAYMRHMLDAVMAGDPGARDHDGALHAVKQGWRAMAHLQRLADSGVNIFAEEPAPESDWLRDGDLLSDNPDKPWHIMAAKDKSEREREGFKRIVNPRHSYDILVAPSKCPNCS